MTATIIDGKALGAQMQLALSGEIEAFEKAPTLAVVLVGDNPASVLYVKNKEKIAKKIGIQVMVHQLSPVMTQETLRSFIRELNKDDAIDGIMIQMPLPPHMNADVVLDTVDPEKDADGLHCYNLGRLFTGRSNLIPCTPLACMEMIRQTGISLVGKNAVVVGRSRLVGKPVAQLLLDAGCTVTQAHSHTHKKDLKKVCLDADVLVSATGVIGLIKKEFIKPGAVVVDVGIARSKDGKVMGDVAQDVCEVAGFMTPVPGGVGPMTVTMLMYNVVQIHRKKVDAELF